MRFLLSLLLVVTATNIYAQNRFRIGSGVLVGDESQLHEIILVDFSKLLGHCAKIDKNTVFFKLRDAIEVTELPIDQVRFLGVYEQTGNTITRGRNGEKAAAYNRVAFADGTYLRTALPTHTKGQYRNIDLIYNVAEFNLNRNVQLGVGAFVPAGFLSTQRLRFSIAKEVHLGVSNQSLLVLLSIDPPFIVGDLNANFTVGNENRFVNFGGGFFYNTSDDMRTTHLNIAMGGRIAENWHVYGEMAVFDDGFDIIALPSFSAAHGVRRHRWRFGFFNVFNPESSFLAPLPFIGYDYYW